MSLGTVPARLLFPLAERAEGRSIRPKLARLRAEASEPAERRRRRQAARLSAIAAHAGAHVPYYRDLFARLRFDPTRLARDPGALDALPPLDRDGLVAAGRRLVDERLDPDRLETRRTGGSTGPAATIYYTAEALDWTAAVNLFVRERIGKPPFAREAHLSTAPGTSIPLRDRLREGVKCVSLNRTNLPLASLDASTLDALWRDLARARPRLVQGHPSTLHALARHVRDRGGLARPLFATFESTGETLDPGVRKTIAEALRCRVVDRYGSAEFGVVAYEWPDGRTGLEILDGVVHAETLPDGDGHDELVLTGLLNPAMPLLRYRTGDRVRLAREADEIAGRIVAVQGRVHDTVAIGGRRIPTHVLQDRLDRLGCVEEFQVEVGGEAPPRLRVAAPPAEHGRVRAAVHDWWGDALELEFAERGSFVRTGWRGKFRHVVRRP